MDPLEDFYDSACVFGDKDKVWVKSETLYSAYKIWAHSRGMRDKDISTQKMLTMRLVNRRGCEPDRTNEQGRIVRGIGLATALGF